MTLFITDVWMGFATWHLASSNSRPKTGAPVSNWLWKKVWCDRASVTEGGLFYGKSRRIREMKVSTAEQFFLTLSWKELRYGTFWPDDGSLEKKLHFTSQSFKIVMSQIMRILHADVSVGRNNSSKRGRGDWLYRKRALKSSVSNLFFLS